MSLFFKSLKRLKSKSALELCKIGKYITEPCAELLLLFYHWLFKINLLNLFQHFFSFLLQWLHMFYGNFMSRISVVGCAYVLWRFNLLMFLSRICNRLLTLNERKKRNTIELSKTKCSSSCTDEGQWDIIWVFICWLSGQRWFVMLSSSVSRCVSVFLTLCHNKTSVFLCVLCCSNPSAWSSFFSPARANRFSTGWWAGSRRFLSEPSMSWWVDGLLHCDGRHTARDFTLY